MTWSAMLARLKVEGLLLAHVTADLEVSGVTQDSRAVVPGMAFVAVVGQRADGTAFVADARTRGAVAIITESAEGIDGIWAQVTDARRALAVAACATAGDPSAHLRVIGITGTNGKTTTAHLVAAICDAAGTPSGIVGTLGYQVGQTVHSTSHTTPEAPQLQAMLVDMVARGVGACAMEVSSHALALHRVAGTHFAAAVFTNLTRDHLDFHADMEQYFQAKRRLFEMLPRGAPAVINLDDPRAHALAAVATRAVTYGLAANADVTPVNVEMTLGGIRCDVQCPDQRIAITSALVGRPNLYNILAAVAVAWALGIPATAIAAGIAAVSRVPGRFEVVSGPSDDISVVVDYAHTDDALRNLLETASALTAGRLVTVFGCGGDRDRSKRPLMGMVAGRLSDVVVLTSDNPRSEDPARIVEDIERGITPDTRRQGLVVHVELDRREAIAHVIRTAMPGDVILVAGKGHEQTQVIGAETRPFSDVAVAGEALAARRRLLGAA